MSTAADRVAELAARLPVLRRRPAATVLCYHGVTAGEPSGRYAVGATALARHLALLAAAGHRVAGAAELAAGAGRGVAVTFDDNEPSHAAEALAVLRAAGIRATFFVTPGELGEPGRLDEAGVARLAAAGMAIGAHGHRHIRVAELPVVDFARDVAECRAFLERLGMPLVWAYPGGDPGSFTPEHDAILADAGFAVRFTTVEGPLRPGPGPHPRYVIRSGSSDRYVQAAAAGGLGLVAAAKRLRSRWR